jgi:hypothetical protein
LECFHHLGPTKKGGEGEWGAEQQNVGKGKLCFLLEIIGIVIMHSENFRTVFDSHKKKTKLGQHGDIRWGTINIMGVGGQSNKKQVYLQRISTSAKTTTKPEQRLLPVMRRRTWRYRRSSSEPSSATTAAFSVLAAVALARPSFDLVLKMCFV